MADLRIVDTPLLSTVKGTEKIPTGGEGNFSVSVNQVADFAKLKWFLATEEYVDNAVGNVQDDLDLHKNNESNPHNVTKTQVGLGNVDNTADLDKPVSNATQSAIITANSGKADKSYVDSQDQLKADKVQVASDLSLKADKSTTYTKAETDSLVTPKADKSYVDSAVGAISTDASKQYATLALANADIANIALNKNIFVSEAANGGYWYKATAGATSLTKSPYDPLTQAKSYSEQQRKLGENQIFQAYFANPYYEVSANSLYFKPYAISLDRVLICFDRRYGYFAITLTDFNAQLAALFPADRINVTSPKGVTGCFQFTNEDTISINPISKLITNSITVASNKQDIPLIAWNYTDVRRCTEESRIRQSIAEQRLKEATDNISNYRNNYDVAVVVTNSGGGNAATMPVNLQANNYAQIIYDTSTNILYVPNGTLVYTKESNSFIATTVGQALDISTLVASNSLIKVYISKATKLLSAKVGTTALTVDERSDLILFCVLRITGSVFEITSTFDYKVDFSRNGIDISSDRVTFIPTSGTNAFINYDSATSKLTIPNGTLIRYGQLTVALPETEIDFKNTTTAQNLYYDLYTRTFVVKVWSYALTVKERFRFVFVMGIRDNSINNTNRDTQAVKIDATFPYTVDGIRYGIQIPSTTVVKNTLDDSVKAIAHRGYSADAPENTLPAYVLASQKGFSYVECDVNFTSDGVPVLLHDDTINRTSNGVGSINDLTIAQVKTYDFGYPTRFGSKYAGTNIPTFEEFLKLCFKLNLHPYIELKSFVGDTTAKTQIIIDMVERLGMKGRVSYIGSLQAMTIVKDLDESARIGVVTSTSVGAWLPTLQGLRTGTNQVFADALIGTYTEAEIQGAAEAGISVEIWTTNTVSDVITAANLGISGITTDNLNIRQILNESYG